MNIALWIIAGLLAVASLASGAMKLTQPKEKLASGYGWVEDFGAGAVKAIGTLEVLAAVGLILPAALDIAPVLVPLAAVGPKRHGGGFHLLPPKSAREPDRYLDRVGSGLQRDGGRPARAVDGGTDASRGVAAAGGLLAAGTGSDQADQARQVVRVVAGASP
jgi:DoxX-like family